MQLDLHTQGIWIPAILRKEGGSEGRSESSLSKGSWVFPSCGWVLNQPAFSRNSSELMGVSKFLKPSRSAVLVRTLRPWAPRVSSAISSGPATVPRYMTSLVGPEQRPMCPEWTPKAPDARDPSGPARAEWTPVYAMVTQHQLCTWAAGVRLPSGASPSLRE